MIWQRKWVVIAATLLCFIAGIAAAYTLPTIYRSKATMLVQAQDLPSNIVQSPVSGGVEQRIAAIRERVLSRGDLIALIDQYDLYPVERRSEPLSVVVEKMRTATSVSALSGSLDGGTATDNAIAVTLTFDYPEPGKAQTVLQNFVGSFLKIDSDAMEEQARLSVRFLEDQASKLQSQISQIENNITTLKARNGSALASSGVPLVDTGNYSAQITNLENQNRQLLAANRTGGKTSELATAQAMLSSLKTRYSDSHPDVIAAEERVRQLRSQPVVELANSDLIAEQIRANNAAIAQLSAQRSDALSRASAAAAGSARAPVVLEQAMQLESRASTLREQYRTIATELLKAQNTARMAGEQRAERLTLVDAPDLPDTPTSPNRPLFILGGLVAGLGLGLLLALGAEFIFKPLRSPSQIERLGLPVLGLVPVLEYDARPGIGRFFKFWQWRRARA
ncbi:lipopolysaccharide biosynthesis protein [Sphingomonas rhizophila]|uniref:Lipopolysaccharide biosynthesis protein n=1 Tax=Sphingomonas rhizophila TaxID=2071607 RepID=A0A7G9SBV3_9SPHN|nr:Wzz/FepE/Etk N-terminal domain-containing protein [Sphingomonas rhizophila]QNN65328.1 lipopolysaccharide biosynthesis protein [Sphingomonas rhizophila]